jgi:AhpD family alkylhydroperoxidase
MQRSTPPRQNQQGKISMSIDMYPQSTNEIQDRRRTLAPQQLKAFHEFSRQAFAEGALGTKVKQLIAVAVAHATQCPYCIRGHTAGALKAGASSEEIMEAIWVAAEMRAGAAYAHSTIALDEMQEYAQKQR